MQNQKAQKSLTKKEKEVVGLLSIGTFLEYFDLMLYVHMAVLLNELFFPQGDKVIAEILAIFTFCSTFILRPVGGVIIGWIGDQVGRKNTIIITTLLMSVCCLVMANLGTYDEIGIVASIGIITCRILQGFTSMGEIVGAQIYLTETLKQPYRYICSNIININSKLGGFFALTIASISLSIAFNWRAAFMIGAVIAIVGIVARTRLRETAEFTNYKRRYKSDNKVGAKSKIKYKIDKKAVFSYFFLHLPFAFCFYTAFIYTGAFMKESMGMSSEDVISQNLKLNILFVVALIIVSFFIKKYHPLRLAKINTILSLILLIFIPFWFNNVSSLLSLSLLQLAILSFEFTVSVAAITSFKHIAIPKRFTFVAIAFGMSGAIGYGFAPIILTFISKYIGHYAIWIAFILVIIPYWYALNYIKKLEIKKGNYNHYPYKDEDVEEDVYAYNYALREEYKAYQKECKYSKKLIDMLKSLNKTARQEVNIKLIEKAIVFAKKWHAVQKRKTGEPYYTHPLAVAMMTAQYKFKTHIIVAAILHDVVEDSDCTVELIAKEFNPRIADIVGLLTREYKDKKLTIAESIKKIFDATDYDALLIKGLDRVHNLQTIGGMESKKQKEIAEETIYEIASIAAYAVDDLNINDKRKLERKLYKLSNRTLKTVSDRINRG
ncbi:MFS transporter [Candidatus Aquarickettsia rohweri]|uniref:MFS transporter n=1 Tax=Candidatus Aquarickettsia rohweri TaxID=2602574 RepID=A0A3R9ZJL7_9RICK|nr:MFS transporter [Candidatus Aquarickettsia rohweri]RST64477.1 MFS transporter [Candidatus Aquarickettsia rohweri]